MADADGLRRRGAPPAGAGDHADLGVRQVVDADYHSSGSDGGGGEAAPARRPAALKTPSASLRHKASFIQRKRSSSSASSSSSSSSSDNSRHGIERANSSPAAAARAAATPSASSFRKTSPLGSQSAMPHASPRSVSGRGGRVNLPGGAGSSGGGAGDDDDHDDEFFNAKWNPNMQRLRRLTRRGTPDSLSSGGSPRGSGLRQLSGGSAGSGAGSDLDGDNSNDGNNRPTGLRAVTSDDYDDDADDDLLADADDEDSLYSSNIASKLIKLSESGGPWARGAFSCVRLTLTSAGLYTLIAAVGLFVWGCSQLHFARDQHAVLATLDEMLPTSTAVWAVGEATRRYAALRDEGGTLFHVLQKLLPGIFAKVAIDWVRRQVQYLKAEFRFAEVGFQNRVSITINTLDDAADAGQPGANYRKEFEMRTVREISISELIPNRAAEAAVLRATKKITRQEDGPVAVMTLRRPCVCLDDCWASAYDRVCCGSSGGVCCGLWRCVYERLCCGCCKRCLCRCCVPRKRGPCRTPSRWLRWCCCVRKRVLGGRRGSVCCCLWRCESLLPSVCGRSEQEFLWCDPILRLPRKDKVMKRFIADQIKNCLSEATTGSSFVGWEMHPESFVRERYMWCLTYEQPVSNKNGASATNRKFRILMAREGLVRLALRSKPWEV